jgi:23S rRNA pseudouridine2605 synthase
MKPKPPPANHPPPTQPKPPPSPRQQQAAPEGERLQKLIAAAGHASRRTVEEWIRAGRVTLNGRVATLGDRALPQDRVEVDGVPVAARAQGNPSRVIAYHKPVGEIVSRSDPGGRRTVFDALPAPREGKWVAVGRLDLNTSGLLLLTTDGEIANRLMHPSYEVEREYAIRVQGGLGAEQLAALRTGVPLEGIPARFERLDAARGQEPEGANRWYRGVLKEGRNREVRRLVEAVGRRVSRLIRVRYGPVELPQDLAAGQWRELPAAVVSGLSAIARKPKIR